MHMIQDLTVRSSAVARTSVRVAATAFLAGAATLGLYAQNVAGTDGPNSYVSMASVTPAINLANVSFTSYSSSVGVAESSSAENFIPSASDSDAATNSDAMQPPPRRRYGRPRYNDSSHNSDGSNKFAFLVGAGLSLPVSDLKTYDTPSWKFQVGGGRNFNKKFGVLLQFDYDHFGLQGSTLTNQETIYNYGCTPALQNAGTCTLITNLDGNSHIWSFTLDPKFNFYQGGTTGAYVVGGAGFYHKVTNFTLPETGEECFYYGCYDVTANEVVDHYSANAVGFSGGLGLTYKLSKFANEQVYVEGRYVYVPFSERSGLTINNYLTTLYAGYNYYPANSHHTSYIPITVGLRF